MVRCEEILQETIGRVRVGDEEGREVLDSERGEPEPLHTPDRRRG